MTSDHYRSPKTVEELRVRLAGAIEVNPELIGPDTLFVEDLGAKSINAILVCLALEEWFGVEVSNDAVWELVNLRTVVEFLRQKGVSLSD
ncbi:MAG: phosphopantetheine-binding protein [Chthonomonadales bacterium]